MSPGASGLSVSGPALVPVGLGCAWKLLCGLQRSLKEAAWTEMGVWEPLSFPCPWGRMTPGPSRCWGAPSWEGACPGGHQLVSFLQRRWLVSRAALDKVLAAGGGSRSFLRHW